MIFLLELQCLAKSKGYAQRGLVWACWMQLFALFGALLLVTSPHGEEGQAVICPSAQLLFQALAATYVVEVFDFGLVLGSVERMAWRWGLTLLPPGSVRPAQSSTWEMWFRSCHLFCMGSQPAGCHVLSLAPCVVKRGGQRALCPARQQAQHQAQLWSSLCVHVHRIAGKDYFVPKAPCGLTF